MRKILVTGGAGNIGGSQVRRLVAEPDNFVVSVDNLVTGALNKLPPETYTNWKFIKCDCNDNHSLTTIMLEERFDYVFHYAALVGVQRILDNPIAVLKDIDGIKSILNLSKDTGVKRVFFSSSSEVYGEPVEIPQNESTTPLNSRLPYAIVKNVGEAYFRAYYQEFGLEYTIFRFFNTYGPLQTTDFVVSRFLKLAIKNEPIRIYGDGGQTRTFCYIEDNLNVTTKALYSDHFVNDVINIGSDEEITIRDLAIRIKNLVHSTSKLEYLPPLKEGDMTRRKPDISKMRRVLNRKLTSLEEGVLKMMTSI